VRTGQDNNRQANRQDKKKAQEKTKKIFIKKSGH